MVTDRAVIVAALIVGGAIVAASFSARARYSLSAAANNIAWRMDTWSGRIDLCAATYLPSGPLVRCGATVIVPGHPDAPAKPGDTPTDEPLPPIDPAQPQKLDHIAMHPPRG
jgi:hypothetical protein